MNHLFTPSRAILAMAVFLLAVLAAPGPAMAQAASDAAKPAKASNPKPAAKAPVKNKEKAAPSASRIQLKSAAKNVAAGIEAAEAALTPDELAIAERVHVGQLPCELGASVTLVADSKAPGYFDLQGKNFKYRMFPVPTTTNTVRLEDRKAGAVWLQMGNKSMLMSQKLGIRLADECMSPAQMTVAEAIKLNPPASVLDAPRPALKTSSAAPAAAATPASAAK